MLSAAVRGSVMVLTTAVVLVTVVVLPTLTFLAPFQSLATERQSFLCCMSTSV